MVNGYETNDVMDGSAGTRMLRWITMCARKVVLGSCLIILCVGGCGKLPLISENRKNFAPWEKCPEQGGIRYIEKYVRDPGHDPIYLALIKYESDADLTLVVQTFGLNISTTPKRLTSYAASLKSPPSWFPLKDAKDVYAYPSSDDGYTSNLWVDTDKKVMILERSWF